MSNKNMRVLLDSGAFSTWTKGKVIDIDEYISYIKKNEKYIFYAINLDVIPGAPNSNSKISSEQLEYACRQSWDNFLYMKKKGIKKVMPVFHYGEDLKWLRKFIDYGEKYIGLGGIARGKTMLQKKKWLNSVFYEIDKRIGLENIKIHGLGITSLYILKSYPWYSVDSFRWALTALNGEILIPKRTIDGELDFSVRPNIVIVTSRTLRVRKSSINIDNVPSSFYNWVEYYLQSRFSFSLKDVIEIEENRCIVNLYYYYGVQQSILYSEVLKRFRRMVNVKKGFF